MCARELFNRTPEAFHVLIARDALQQRIAEIGEQITREYSQVKEDLVLVGVLKGSLLFLADLCRQIHLPVVLDFIGISSYGDETKSSGVVQITSDLTRPIENKHVIIVEDMTDTGLTAAYLLENLATRHPKSLKMCSLLHKPSRTIKPVPIEYLGFTVPNKFVVGYGLDWEQRYRNLEFIGFDPAYDEPAPE